jgi:hypothetical protein
MPQSSFSNETAYFVNSRLPCVALIAKGVRFPPGQWVRLADGEVQPWIAQRLARDLFPSLEPRGLIFAELLTDFDVREFAAGRYRIE